MPVALLFSLIYVLLSSAVWVPTAAAARGDGWEASSCEKRTLACTRCPRGGVQVMGGTGCIYPNMDACAKAVMESCQAEKKSTSTSAALGPRACEAQRNQCSNCPNGKGKLYGLCMYDNLMHCRQSVTEFCKQHPYSDKPLVVKGGRLSKDQVLELISTCRNIARSDPYAGTEPAPGSKRDQQCKAFEKKYTACGLLFSRAPAGDERRADCLRAYDGP